MKEQAETEERTRITNTVLRLRKKRHKIPILSDQILTLECGGETGMATRNSKISIQNWISDIVKKKKEDFQGRY